MLKKRKVRSIFDIIKKVNRENNTTIFLVEQNANMAMELAEYAYVMETGRIILEGPSEQLRRDEKVIHAYLGGGMEEDGGS